jgi:hypothetical protein
VNLLIWIAVLWTLTFAGRCLHGVAPLRFWPYAAPALVLLAAYLYAEGLRPILQKVREVDAMRARGETPVIWRSDYVARVSIGAWSLALGTSLYGLPGIRYCRFGYPGYTYGVGLEARYFSVSFVFRRYRPPAAPYVAQSERG